MRLLDAWLDNAKRGVILAESIVIRVARECKALLMEEPNVLMLTSPVVVAGDIHGQFEDLIELFARAGGWPDGTACPSTHNKGHPMNNTHTNRESNTQTNEQSNPSYSLSTSTQTFLFLGDYVDRGRQGLECIVLLMLLKLRHPDRIFLLRGNHESRQISQVYGFYDECLRKYGSASVWHACCDLFDYLAIGALVDGRIFGIHAGLSPSIRTIDQIRLLSRGCEIPHTGALSDMLWSDPEDLTNERWAIGPRGAGYLFGRRVVMEWNFLNDLNLLVRAHQLVKDGWQVRFPEASLVTVWSAPNYCMRYKNAAAVMCIAAGCLDISYRTFSSASSCSSMGPSSASTAIGLGSGNAWNTGGMEDHPSRRKASSIANAPNFHSNTNSVIGRFF